MTRNSNKYKWRNSWNNGNGAWIFQWKDVHDEWKNKQGKKSSVCFTNTTNNEIIYFSYLMTTSEDFTAESEKGGDDSQDTDFISLINFELLKQLLKRVYYILLLLFTILWCWCGPKYLLILIVIGYGVWGQSPDSVIVDHYWLHLVNHLILWKISMTVKPVN